MNKLNEAQILLLKFINEISKKERQEKKERRHKLKRYYKEKYNFK